MPLDFTGLKIPLKAHDNCEVISISSGAFPRFIEVRLTGKDGARRTALWDGFLNLANNDKVLCHEYPGISILRIVNYGGNQAAGTDGVKVSKVWEPDGSATVLTADNSGHTTVSGDLIVASQIIHSGDADTLLALTDDKINFQAGGKSLLALTETAQDLVEIGDVGGGGDVDVNINNGQVFVEGSTGFVGIGIAPAAPFDLDAKSNTAGIRIRGLAETTEIV